MRILRGTAFLFLAAALALAGCSESSTGPGDPIEEGPGGEPGGPGEPGDPPEDNGRRYMRADISGAYTAKLDATDSDMGEDPEEWTDIVGATLIKESGITLLIIVGAEVTGTSQAEGKGHLIDLLIRDPEAKTYSGSDLCESADDLGFWIGTCKVVASFNAADGELAWQAFLDKGSIEIETLTDEEVIGIFEFSGQAYTMPLSEWETEPDIDDLELWDKVGEIEVTEGEYSVEILDDLGFIDMDNPLPIDGLTRQSPLIDLRSLRLAPAASRASSPSTHRVGPGGAS